MIQYRVWSLFAAAVALGPALVACPASPGPTGPRPAARRQGASSPPRPQGVSSSRTKPAAPRAAKSKTTVEEAALIAAIRKRYKPSFAGCRLDIQFAPATHPGATPAWLEVGWGFGHGHHLSSVRIRFASGKPQVDVEQWQWGGIRAGRKGSARRASVEPALAARLARYAGLLARVKLVEVRPRPKAGLQMGVWGSSSDLYVVVRVGRRGGGVHVHDFVGYHSSSTQLRYLALTVVRDEAKRFVQGVGTWKRVPADKLRGTHFVDTFLRNRALMHMKQAWWVMEYSVEALGTFGTPLVLPTVRALRNGIPKLLPRQIAKLDAILQRPKHYLAGAAKPVP